METTIITLFIIMAICVMIIIGIIGENIFTPKSMPEKANKILCIFMIIFGVALFIAVLLGVAAGLLDDTNSLKH